MAVSLVSTGVTFPDNSTQTTAATGFGFKNRIINGGMVIDQRNAGASVTPTNQQYTLDRWLSVVGVVSKFSVQQRSTDSSASNYESGSAPSGFINSLKVTSLSAYSVAAGDVFAQETRIEGVNTADLGWGTASAQAITVSFWVRSSLTGNFGGVIRNSANTRSYPFLFAISSANTWEYKTVTIAGDTSGTWLTNNLAGVKITFGLGVGATYSGTAGSWAGAEYYGATGATSVVGTNGATLYITGVQLEKGSTATSFDYRPYGTELALCQRYYQVQVAGSYVFAGRSSSTTAVLYSVPLQVAMRASPTINSAAIIAYGTTSANLSSGGASTVNTFGTNSLVFQRTGYTGITDDRVYNGYSGTDGFTLSSEL